MIYPTVGCDVAIVGAGPIGLALALLLAQARNRVHIYERHPLHFAQPRAIGIFQQSVRVFEGLGLSDRLIGSAFRDIRGIVSDICEWVNHDGETLVSFPLNGTGESGPVSYALHQPTLEVLLEEACKAEPNIQLFRSMNVESVKDHGGIVELCVSPIDDPAAREVVVSRFVVGCDGANSTVRKSLGINFVDLPGVHSVWVVVDVKPFDQDASAHWVDADMGKQYLDYKRPRTSCPSHPIRRRWEFMVLPHESPERAKDPEFIWPLLAEYGVRPDQAVIEKAAVYELRGGWAESFRKGRVALAGDAAHVAPPFLAQGINSGFRDVKALSWRIDLALKHPHLQWDRLLEDYSTEQLGTTKAFVQGAVALEHIFCVLDPNQAKMRDHMVRSTIPPIPDLELLGMPGMYVDTAAADQALTLNQQPGRLFMDHLLRRREQEGTIWTFCKTGWILLEAEGAPDQEQPVLSQTTQAAFSELMNGHSAKLGESEYQDVTGKLSSWFTENHIVAVLLRPDYYLYGVAKSVEEIEPLLKGVLDILQ